MHPTLAYFGPEALLPATSIIATALGFILLVGRGSYRLILHALRFSTNRSKPIADTSTPHYNHTHISHEQPHHVAAHSMSATAGD